MIDIFDSIEGKIEKQEFPETRDPLDDLDPVVSKCQELQVWKRGEALDVSKTVVLQVDVCDAREGEEEGGGGVRDTLSVESKVSEGGEEGFSGWGGARGEGLLVDLVQRDDQILHG